MKKHTYRVICFSSALFLLFCAAFCTGRVQAAEETPSSSAAEAEPAETKPAEAVPTETTPAETTPAETRPAETKPVQLDQTITGVESDISRSLSVKSFYLKPSGKGKVTYASSNPKIASVNRRGKVSLLKVGTVIITISYAGNKTYKPATFRTKLTIIPRNISLNYVKHVAEGELEIDWKSADKTITRFEVQAAKNLKFSKKLRETTVPKKYDGLYWGGFSKGTWYVRCRRMVKKSGKPYYSSWSEPVKVDVKR